MLGLKNPDLPGYDTPGSHVLADFDTGTPGRLSHRGTGIITQGDRNILNYNQKYFNPLVSGPDRLEL